MYLGRSQMMENVALCVLCISVSPWLAYVDTQSPQWPQWRGPSRDGVAVTQAPASWPATLTQKWKVTVGSGYATPIVADGRVYIHARTGEQETITAYDIADSSTWAHPALVGNKL